MIRTDRPDHLAARGHDHDTYSYVTKVPQYDIAHRSNARTDTSTVTCKRARSRAPARLPPARFPLPYHPSKHMHWASRAGAAAAACCRSASGEIGCARHPKWAPGRTTWRWPPSGPRRLRLLQKGCVASAPRLPMMETSGGAALPSTKTSAAFCLTRKRRTHSAQVRALFRQGRGEAGAHLCGRKLVSGRGPTARRSRDVCLDGQLDCAPCPWQASGKSLEVPQRHPRTLRSPARQSGRRS